MIITDLIKNIILIFILSLVFEKKLNINPLLTFLVY
jgi:hypothetical protein